MTAHNDLIARLEKGARLADEIGRESSASLFAEAAGAIRAMQARLDRWEPSMMTASASSALRAKGEGNDG